jgi:hypothetical protein
MLKDGAKNSPKSKLENNAFRVSLRVDMASQIHKYHHSVEIKSNSF